MDVPGLREIANSLPGLRAELRGQIVRFRELLGHWPTHLDSHHHIQQAPNLLPLFLEVILTFLLLFWLSV